MSLLTRVLAKLLTGLLMGLLMRLHMRYEAPYENPYYAPCKTPYKTPYETSYKTPSPLEFGIWRLGDDKPWKPQEATETHRRIQAVPEGATKSSQEKLWV